MLHNKKQYLDLLLLADEQETMIDRYLERGEMFVLSEDGSIRASCVVTREAEDVFEINLKSASNLNGNLNCSKELEHYAS